jgi:hypothetical protein
MLYLAMLYLAMLYATPERPYWSILVHIGPYR